MADDHEGLSNTIVLVVDRSLPMPATCGADLEAVYVRRGEIVDALTARLEGRIETLIAFSEIAYHYPPRDDDVWLRWSGNRHVLCMEPFTWFDPVYGTNLAHALDLARKDCTESGTQRILVVTYNEPSAHIEDTPGDTFFCYPPASETFRAVEDQAGRCRSAGIRVDVVALGGYTDSAADVFARLVKVLADLTGAIVVGVPADEAANDAAQRVLASLALG